MRMVKMKPQQLTLDRAIQKFLLVKESQHTGEETMKDYQNCLSRFLQHSRNSLDEAQLENDVLTFFAAIPDTSPARYNKPFQNIHSVHLAPAIILSEVLGIPPTHPAKSFITNSAIGLWQILPKHTKSIFFIALALLRYFFQYSRKSPVRREALKCILLRMVPVATQYTKKIL